MLEIIITECNEYITITVNCSDETSLSWEQLQDIKDRFRPDIDFIEVYPKKSEIVNKANVRHLTHVKNMGIPYLCDLERPCYVETHMI